MTNYKIYAEELEDAALAQFTSAMALPCVVGGALMPDAHTGYALPIGAVVATLDMIFPAWVGYDIGCGMCAIPTTFMADAVMEKREQIHAQIHRDIPTGFNGHKDPQPFGRLEDLEYTDILGEVMGRRNARRQLGTLGGGNHFIEIGYDIMDRVWVIIHSGSRGVGHGTATEYMRKASPDGKVREGHHGFEEYSTDGRNYITDLKWCLEYALENRKRMLEATVNAIQRYTPGDANWEDFINRNHNHAEQRVMAVNDTLTEVWIHRKGATHAELGMKGVIPGNMRDGCYIVTGKGNPDSLWSSSHGAGRAMSRKKARETLDMQTFEEEMGSVKADVKLKTLDEAPGAYKDIHNVIALQKDLLEVDAYVRPIINVKGF